MKKTLGILFLLLFCFTTSVEGASIASILKKIAKKTKKLFDGKKYLEDQALISGNYIIAYEPYYLIEKGHFGRENYHYHLLTDLVVGDYDINPTSGKPRFDKAFNVHQNYKDLTFEGDELNIVEFSRKKNAKLRILLNLSLQNDFGIGYENNRAVSSFFGNKQFQQDTLINRLKYTFKDWEKKHGLLLEESGVVLDFQNFKSNNPRLKENILSFIKKLDQSVGLVYLKLPLNPETQIFYQDETFLNALKEHVNLFIVKAYNFSELEQNQNSCIPPVNMFQVERSLKFYNENDSLIATQNMVVEFPAYGVANENLPAEEYPSVRYLPIGKVYEKFRKGKVTYIDSTHRAYARVLDVENDCSYCVEDSLTLNSKYKWVLKSGYGGIGIMGLGYVFEGNSPKPKEKWWWALANEVARPTSPLGWSIASLVFLFICMGYIVSVAQYWQVRNVLAKYQNRLLGFGGRFALFFFLFLLCANIIPRNFIGLLIIGLILGFFILMRVLKRYLAKVRRYGKYAQHV